MKDYMQLGTEKIVKIQIMAMEHLKNVLVCFLSVLTATSFGQSVQSGYVKEYNERMQKTPLSEVEIVISNASSTISGGDGGFKLQFRTLKPGDKVNVRRIEKLGYEIFNKEALEQWFISRDNRPFTIVMCRSDRFKRIRDNYSRVSSSSYDRQFRREVMALEKERKDGKIKEEDYEKKLATLNDEYEKKLEKLENYVDHFARIDLSELSAKEAEIIELVQQGEIDRAISKYEEEKLEEIFRSQVNVIHNISSAISALTEVERANINTRDSIFAAIMRKNDLLKLKGGKDSFEKIEKTLKEIADADTSFYLGIKAYADFLYQQHKYEVSYDYYKRCFQASEAGLPKIEILLCLQKSAYMSGMDIDASTYFGNTRLKLIKTLYDNQSKEYAVGCAESYRFLGFAQRAQKYYDNAKGYFLKAIDCLLPFKSELTEEENMLFARLMGNVGSVDLMEKRYEDAEKSFMKARNIMKVFWDKNPGKQNANKAENSYGLARAYAGLKQYENSSEYFEECYTIYSKLAQKNPVAYSKSLIESLISLGRISVAGKYNKAKADIYYAQALDFINKANKITGIEYDKQKAEVLRFFAIRKCQKEDYLEALQLIEEAIELNKSMSNLELKGRILVSLGRKDEAFFIWNTHLRAHYAGREYKSLLYKMLNQ